jgi:Skp family chaperone for outer membrane proteins
MVKIGILFSRKIPLPPTRMELVMLRQWLAAVVLGVMYLSQTLSAEEFSVATVDVLRIFRELPRIHAQMEDAKTQTQELEGTVQIRQVEIEGVQRKLQTPLSAADREKLTLQLSKLQTELRLFIERERQNVEKRNLSLQVVFYKEVAAEVKKIADEKKIKLVMVRPKFSLDSPIPQQQAAMLNQIFIYEDPSVDITDLVLEKLKSQTEPAKTSEK